MKKVLYVLTTLIIAASTACGTYAWQHQKVNESNKQTSALKNDLTKAKDQIKSLTNLENFTSKKGVNIKLYSPKSNTKLVSPLIVIGEVPGNWSFEASFPVKLLDSKGKVLAESTAQLLGDWMTEKLVPFTAKFTFSGAPTGTGSLILYKDNPSGLPQNDDSLTLPVSF